LKCEVCQKETKVNYGSGSSVICQKYIRTKEASELMAQNTNIKHADGDYFSHSFDFSNPYVIGIAVTILGLLLGILMEDITRINILVWGIYIFFGIFATSVALILKELKGFKK